MTFEEGPYVNLACFYTNLIESVDGTNSLIGNYCELVHKIKDNSEKDVGFSEELKMYIELATGKAFGHHQMAIIPELPSGKKMSPVKRKFSLKDDDSLGISYAIDAPFKFTEEGCYWFNVYIDNNLITKIPLIIQYKLVKARIKVKSK